MNYVLTSKNTFMFILSLSVQPKNLPNHYPFLSKYQLKVYNFLNDYIFTFRTAKFHYLRLSIVTSSATYLHT